MRIVTKHVYETESERSARLFIELIVALIKLWVITLPFILAYDILNAIWTQITSGVHWFFNEHEWKIFSYLFFGAVVFFGFLYVFSTVYSGINRAREFIKVFFIGGFFFSICLASGMFLWAVVFLGFVLAVSVAWKEITSESSHRIFAVVCLIFFIALLFKSRDSIGDLWEKLTLNAVVLCYLYLAILAVGAIGWVLYKGLILPKNRRRLSARVAVFAFGGLGLSWYLWEFLYLQKAFFYYGSSLLYLVGSIFEEQGNKFPINDGSNLRKKRIAWCFYIIAVCSFVLIFRWDHLHTTLTEKADIAPVAASLTDESAALNKKKEAEDAPASKPNATPKGEVEGSTAPETPKVKSELARLQELAARGNPDAQFKLGKKYESGDGVPVNKAEAVKLFRKAAGQGDADALASLTRMSEQGDTYAQINLGAMYYNGEGVKPDKLKAFRLYEAADDLGDPNARENLKRLAFELLEDATIEYWSAGEALNTDSDKESIFGEYSNVFSSLANAGRNAESNREIKAGNIEPSELESVPKNEVKDSAVQAASVTGNGTTPKKEKRVEEVPAPKPESSPPVGVEDSVVPTAPSSSESTAPNRGVTVANIAPPKPQSGEGVWYVEGQARNATEILQIINSDDYDYYVKLTYNERDVLGVFVRRGDRVEMPIPQGTYRVSYNKGSTWHGYGDYFGADGIYGTVDKVFSHRDGFHYRIIFGDLNQVSLSDGWEQGIEVKPGIELVEKRTHRRSAPIPQDPAVNPSQTNGASAPRRDLGPNQARVVSATPIVETIYEEVCYSEKGSSHQSDNNSAGQAVGEAVGLLAQGKSEDAAGAAIVGLLGAITDGARGNNEECYMEESPKKEITGYEVIYEYDDGRRGSQWMDRDPGPPGSVLDIDVPEIVPDRRPAPPNHSSR